MGLLTHGSHFFGLYKEPWPASLAHSISFFFISSFISLSLSQSQAKEAKEEEEKEEEEEEGEEGDGNKGI